MEKELKELSAKVDKLIEVQELILSRLNQGIVLSKETTVTNSTPKKLSKKEEKEIRIQQIKEEITIKHQYGGVFQRQFNLVVVPNLGRIKAYLETKDAKAFDGLKRNK
jgi:hypothetical protein